jgi:hypothetical protein
LAKDKSQTCNGTSDDSSSCSSSSDDSSLAKDKKQECDDSSLTSPSSNGKQREEKKKFTVTFGSKKGDRLEQYNKSDQVMYVNGKMRPVIHLKRNVKYVFIIEQNSDENGDYKNNFIFTEHPTGGKEAKPLIGSFKPIANGVAGIEVNEATPRLFYYQSNVHEFQGGAIWVH